MLLCIDVSQVTTDPKNLAGWCFPREVLNTVIDEETDEMMEGRNLIGNPKYGESWGKSYGNELGRLAQGMPG